METSSAPVDHGGRAFPAWPASLLASMDHLRDAIDEANNRNDELMAQRLMVILRLIASEIDADGSIQRAKCHELNQL